MANFSVKALVRDDLRTTDLIFQNAQVVIEAPLAAAQLEQLVRQLALARSKMIPQVQTGAPTTEAAEIEHIRWRIGTGGGAGRVVLQLPHPGIGWTNLVFDREESLMLIDQLRQAVEGSGRNTRSLQ